MRTTKRHIRICCQAACIVLAVAVPPSFAETVEQVVYRDEQQQQHVVTGRILVEAADGGVMLQSADGAIAAITAEQIVERENRDEQFRPHTAEELSAQLKQEFGDRFEITRTKHYVICSDAGAAYADWCGGLLERLYAGFENYWSRRDFEFTEPQFPLTAIVFANQRDFADFATADAGPETATAKGYYSLKTNRVVLYDLSKMKQNRAARNVAEINRRMARTPFNTATVVHEATHQIAFNCGLHTRYADNPLWFTEGMAMFFETPDLRSRSGWKTIGKLNSVRMNRFKQFGRRRTADSLRTLIESDARLLDAQTAEDAYAESWALSYFLLKTRGDAYADYLKALAAKKPLRFGTPQERIAEFQTAFGEDLNKLEQEWLRFMQRAK
ncbi:hypothetical protein CA54_05840 [Symmachiella macrocystis]|uniref:DUF1570 domain-containing protein n=1 Tax=Symmachiella macrocystis TaxID=2527985 RepID=A0A5C6BMN5_9PLAN|nr:DUF1570 domain-containing protein [Symmachiella macrocystis]TWU11774.1 hypothetical protein CA54_05840 [Symmachiella macrocystis]